MRKKLLERLTDEEVGVLDHDWPGLAHEAQRAPDGDWDTWLFVGGRGAGKTRAGAEWLNQQALAGARLALVGATLHDVREVMVEGPSGLKACAPGWRRPRYHPSRRLVEWPSGAIATAFSAEDADGLRGPQFHAAWADEFCAWRKPGEVLAMLRLGLRLGAAPRLVVTTTPRPSVTLRELMLERSCRFTHAPTAANSANLAPGFLAGLRRQYGGSRLEAQEIEGFVLDDHDALWTADMIAAARGASPGRFDKVVLGLDPPATSHGDACGIVVVGRAGDRAYVLADRSVARRRPSDWARAVAKAVAEFDVDWVIAETNQGGQMIEDLLRSAKCGARVRGVHAVQSKRARAEPVAVLYDQRRVVHTEAFHALEAEMQTFGSDAPGASPDRVDALVWAVSHLLLARRRQPGVRAL